MRTGGGGESSLPVFCTVFRARGSGRCSVCGWWWRTGCSSCPRTSSPNGWRLSFCAARGSFRSFLWLWGVFLAWKGTSGALRSGRECVFGAWVCSPCRGAGCFCTFTSSRLPLLPDCAPCTSSTVSRASRESSLSNRSNSIYLFDWFDWYICLIWFGWSIWLIQLICLLIGLFDWSVWLVDLMLSKVMLSEDVVQ